jgi:hypothetical protein
MFFLPEAVPRLSLLALVLVASDPASPPMVLLPPDLQLTKTAQHPDTE